MISIPRLFFYSIWGGVPLFTKDYFRHVITNPTQKSQLLALQFLLLFIQVIFLYLFHILQHTECCCFVLILVNMRQNLGMRWCRPMWGNPDSGIRESFAYGILNPGFWIPEYSSRNPESHLRLESRIQVLGTNTGIQYLKSGRPSWILLHGRMVTSMEKKMINSFAGQWAKIEELYVT